jgi:hypothetical protein
MKKYSKQDIKNHIANTFGFAINKIVLLEWGTDPIEDCMFRVCDIVYQANYDNLHIYCYIDKYSYIDYEEVLCAQ